MERRHRRVFGAVLALITLSTALVVAPASGAASRPSTRPAQATTAGALRLAAEEEPYCADWIGSCAGSSWGVWILGLQTLPQAFRVSPAGEYVPSVLLVDAPTLEVGPPMTVTYRIRSEAVWSDGTPITSKDFQYTWKQIMSGKRIYDTTGYDKIASIDTTDSKVAVVTFDETFAAWRDLFGSLYFLLPSHLLEGKNRNAEMKNGYAFSGGPYMLEGGAAGWKRGKTLTLVANPKYWGPKPNIEKVVFQFIPESAAEAQAVKTGQVAAAYPLPQHGMLDDFDKTGNLKYTVGFGNAFESLWLNAAQWPLDSKAVRQALLYATDRQTIVDQILRPSIRQGRVLQSFIVPTFPQYYQAAFAAYSPSQAKVDQLMVGDGWTRGSDGIWTKAGKKATIVVSTTAGNEARELTQQLWQSQLEQAGFDLVIKNSSADVLFGKLIPKGKFDVALFTSVGTPDPGLCVIFCSVNIPTKRNGFVGQNYTRLASPTIDSAWSLADTQLNLVQRAATVKAGQTALADEAVSIPLYQSPTVFVYDSSKLGGPLQDNTVEGPFYNLLEWVLK